MRQMLNVDDYRAQARRILPRGLFEYIDRGTEDEVALTRLRHALDSVVLQPSVLTGLVQPDLSTVVLGKTLSAPIVVAPTALAGLVVFDGEVKLARAASAVGIPFCVSTQSITTIEMIRRGAPDAELWFQLYVWRDRSLTLNLLDRVGASGCDTLVVTVDTPVGPNREYNQRNGFAMPMVPSFRAAVDFAMHPRWTLGVMGRYLARDGMPTYGHYPKAFRAAVTRPSVADAVRLEGSLTWDDIALLRDHWRGQIIIKGILSVDDALGAAKLGVDGIVVSAHGGRNLDCLPAPVDVLPAIVDAVSQRLAVLADSGVRRGTDVLKYCTLGASAVLLGRLPLWGLAAGGEAGAEAALRMIVREINTAMAFLGADRCATLGRA